MVQIVELKSSNGSSAKVLVSQGFNCYQWSVPHAGSSLELLWAQPGHESGELRASRSGIPILFPFPGRLRGESFSWRGKSFPLKADDGRGNAIHGFVHTRPWKLEEQTLDSVTASFQFSKQAPELSQSWPTDFRLLASYRLGPSFLAMKIVVENCGNEDLPFGLGAHGYFRLPLGGSRREDCRIHLPVKGRWELNNLIPTGVMEEWPELAMFPSGRRFEETTLDDVFENSFGKDGWAEAKLVDPESQATLKVRSSQNFPKVVVFTPPHREAICIEPYSSLPNAYELSEQDIDTGLSVLAPGETEIFEIEHLFE